jgi:hypothetical protein
MSAKNRFQGSQQSPMPLTVTPSATSNATSSTIAAIIFGFTAPAP